MRPADLFATVSRQVPTQNVLLIEDDAELSEVVASVLTVAGYQPMVIAEHAFSSSLDPIGNYQTYHSSQFEPKGGNDAQVSDPDLDKALENVKNNVDFSVIKDAMKTFQDIYVSKTVEIPLYYRKNVDLVSSKLGNYFSNPTSAGPTWNAVDWYAKS